VFAVSVPVEKSLGKVGGVLLNSVRSTLGNNNRGLLDSGTSGAVEAAQTAHEEGVDVGEDKLARLGQSVDVEDDGRAWRVKSAIQTIKHRYKM